MARRPSAQAKYRKTGFRDFIEGNPSQLTVAVASAFKGIRKAMQRFETFVNNIGRQGCERVALSRSVF
jgi:hypothetical protein